jgi:type IV pilus assembly protein PilM
MELLSRIRGEAATVGLDIGSHSLKLAKIRHRKDGGHLLEAVGIKELKPGTIENGQIREPADFIEAVQHLINQCDPATVEVVIAMSGHGILSDTLRFKVSPDENAEETILMEAGNRSPFDVDDITLDYRILRQFPDENEMDVLLVAAKNQIMCGYIDVLYEAGLQPVIVDVDAFATYNSYALECTNDPDEGSVVLLNVGHELTSITFVKDGIYRSTRDISTAGDFFIRTLTRNLNISKEQAARILQGHHDENIDENLVLQGIEYAAEELSSGIDLAFSYFKSSERSDSIDKIVLSGGGAHIPGLAKFLENRHQTDVRVANPLAFLQYDEGLFRRTDPDDPMHSHEVDPNKIGCFMAVAVGLALRRVVT